MFVAMRKPFFYAAIVLIGLVFLIEIGSAFLSAPQINDPAYSNLATPGMGIPYLALIDGLLFFTILLMAAPLLISDRVHGRIQGIITFLTSLAVLLLAFFMLVSAIMFLMLMVSLLMATPFGTIAYLAAFSDFDKAAAAITLGSIMTLKIAFVVCLFLAHQRFLQNKSLMLVILTSLVATIVVTFLQSIVPGFLASITDDIAAIVIAVLAIIWSVVYLFSSLPSLVRSLKPGAAI